jgi:membrane-associated phospholipid phosphatase
MQTVSPIAVSPIAGLLATTLVALAASAGEPRHDLAASPCRPTGGGTAACDSPTEGGYLAIGPAESWNRSIAVVSEHWPIARAVAPRADADPPRPGRIESGWVSRSPDGMQTAWPHWPTHQERLVVSLAPAGSGTWVTARVETRFFGEMAAGSGGLPPAGGVRAADWHIRQADHPWPAADDDRNVTGSLIARVSSASTAVDGIEYLPTIDLPPAAAAGLPPWAGSRSPRLARAWFLVAEDYRNFYSCESLTGLTAVFGAGALMANTGFDQTLQTAWQESVTPSGVGTFFSGCKDIGEGRYALAAFGAAAATGYLFEGRPAGDVVGAWGERSLRIFVVGGPPVYALQWATGASRPDESSAGSRWKPFQDNNGVSGHAFVGAIPFLAAAGMVENPFAKGGLYVCSTFVAFSRVTDNAHYPSQAFLGWSLAVAGSLAVDRTDFRFAGHEARIVPVLFEEGSGLGFEMEW